MTIWPIGSFWFHHCLSHDYWFNGSLFVPWTLHRFSSIISPLHILSGTIVHVMNEFPILVKLPVEMVRISKTYWSLKRCWGLQHFFKFWARSDEVVDSSLRLKYLSTPAFSFLLLINFYLQFHFFWGGGGEGERPDFLRLIFLATFPNVFLDALASLRPMIKSEWLINLRFRDCFNRA